MNEKIKCRRLLLKSLSLEEMEQIENGRQDFLMESLLTEVIKSAIKYKTEQMRMAPQEAYSWLNYWLIEERRSGQGIGLIGSKHLPDAEGYVELGYTVAEEYRNRGYMTEALEGFLDWLYMHPFCQGAVLSVQETNHSSVKVAQKCGFYCEGIKEGYWIYRYKFFEESC